MILAKVALGIGGTLVLAGAYTFREGVIRVDVDEHTAKGSHVHFWVPAAAVSMALHFVPKDHLAQAVQQAGPWMPTVRALTKELKKLPDTLFIEVRDAEEHVQIRTHNGKLQIDVDAPDQTVHAACPLETLEDLANELEERAPGI